MTDGPKTTKTRLAIIAAGLALSAGTGITYPVAAQSLGSEVVGCVVNSENAVQLGRFSTIGEAIAAAGRASIPANDYGLATIVTRNPNGPGHERMIAIDASGVAHGISSVPCAGSGRRMRPPQ